MGVHELYDTRNNGTVIVKWKEGKPYGNWDEVGQEECCVGMYSMSRAASLAGSGKQSFLHPSSAA